MTQENERTQKSPFDQIREITPFVIQIGTVVTLILGAYLAYHLRPLADSIESLRNEVKAIQDSREQNSAYIPRFIVTEQKVEQQDKTIQDMKDSQIRMEEKIDRIYERIK